MQRQKWNLHKLIDLYYEINNWLKLNLTNKQIEKYCMFIYENMSEEHRYYHNMEHIFNLIIENDYNNNIRAIYHDIVYYQIYQEINEKLYDILKKYIKIEKSDIYIEIKNENFDEESLERINIIIDIFWFKKWQKLNLFWWLNELLSAFIFIEHIWFFLEKNDFIEIVNMIEATIPFRKDYIINTINKITLIEKKYNILLDKDNVIKKWIFLRNKDVSSFYEEDLAVFLESTWKLLPENNPKLRNRDVYSVNDYKNSIYKTFIFFKNIKFKYIINNYWNYPNKKEYEKMMLRIVKNILNAKYFIKFKLIPISIITAVANQTWWDTLMSYFMWELDDKTLRLEDILKEKSKNYEINKWNLSIDNIIFNWLKQDKIVFDVSKSPIVIFLYSNLWFDKMNILWDKSLEFLNWELDDINFLKNVDKNLLITLLEVFINMMPTRKTKIEELYKKLDL